MPVNEATKQKIAEKAKRKGIDPALALAIAEQESDFGHKWDDGRVKVNVNKLRSGKVQRNVGVMQVS
jgi:hypothetical protein